MIGSEPTRKRLLFLVGNLDYFCSHRLPLGLAAHDRGYEVHVAAPIPEGSSAEQCSKKIAPLTFHPVAFQRSSLNPFTDLETLNQINSLYKTVRPHVVHHVAMKPVLYGTMVARWQKIPRIINALGGMGYLFTNPRGLKAVLGKSVLRIFKWLWSTPAVHLIVQNPDDQKLVASLISPERLHLIRGAGVNLSEFSAVPEPTSGPVIITMVARMLLDKGTAELVEAARLLKNRGIETQVQIAGDPDLQNPTRVPETLFAQWKREGVVEFLGHRTDVAALYQQSHIAVLPSYREGLPKSLLEAAACGRPIVTTEAIGCRDVVEDGVTGYLVPVKDPLALADALQKLIESPKLRHKMGQAGRAKVEAEFGLSAIVEQTLALYG